MWVVVKYRWTKRPRISKFKKKIWHCAIDSGNISDEQQKTYFRIQWKAIHFLLMIEYSINFYFIAIFSHWFTLIHNCIYCMFNVALKRQRVLFLSGFWLLLPNPVNLLFQFYWTMVPSPLLLVSQQRGLIGYSVNSDWWLFAFHDPQGNVRFL